MKTLALIVGLVLTAASLTGCQKNAATGDTTLLLLSLEEETRLGAEAAPQFTEQFGGAVNNAALNRYVRNIGERLAAETEADFPDLDWEFTLLDSSVVNAFALPGGKVFITRGLAERLENEAQMAGVLGHEVGHVTAQHGNRRISKQMGIEAVLTGVGVAVAASGENSAVGTYGSVAIPALQLGGNVVLLSYGRADELQADALGMRYMTRIGYNPRAQRQVMKILAEASGGPASPEFLSTHPYPETRIERINELIASDYRAEIRSGNVEFYEDRYERDFLAKLRALPPAAHGGGSAAVAPGMMGGWCACCSGDESMEFEIVEWAAPEPSAELTD